MPYKTICTNAPTELDELYNELKNWEFWKEPKKLTLPEVYEKFNVDIDEDPMNRFLFDVLTKAHGFVLVPRRLAQPQTHVTVHQEVLRWCRYTGDTFAGYSSLLKNHPHLDYVEVHGHSIMLEASDFEDSFWKMRSIDDKHLTYRRMRYIFDKYIEYERDYLSRSVDRLEEEKRLVENENRRLQAKLRDVAQVLDDDVASLAALHFE